MRSRGGVIGELKEFLREDVVKGGHQDTKMLVEK